MATVVTINPVNIINQESCVICLEDYPLPITNLFECGCKALLHNVCLQEWYHKNRNYQCIICRKSSNKIIPVSYTVVEFRDNSDCCRLILVIMCSCMTYGVCMGMLGYLLYVLVKRV